MGQRRDVFFLTLPEVPPPGRYGFAERPPTPGVIRTSGGAADGDPAGTSDPAPVAEGVGGAVVVGCPAVGDELFGAGGFGGTAPLPPPEQAPRARPRPSTTAVVTTARARTPTTPPQPDSRSARTCGSGS
ncbi:MULTISPECIES: hypothetical protein [unclassified Streptomyces]|uniref:hypothetical protein n=1 Tax=unclassified Streptomyces TaxID=2593676 RepID=UPI002E302F99|nr:hypothetical protein [Streptomyces sp. NBC_01268]